MAMGQPYSMAAMLKDGHQMFSGLDEAVLKNIIACKELSLLTKSSMGPNGEHMFFEDCNTDKVLGLPCVDMQRPAAYRFEGQMRMSNCPYEDSEDDIVLTRCTSHCRPALHQLLQSPAWT